MGSGTSAIPFAHQSSFILPLGKSQKKLKGGISSLSQWATAQRKSLLVSSRNQFAVYIHGFVPTVASLAEIYSPDRFIGNNDITSEYC